MPICFPNACTSCTKPKPHVIEAGNYAVEEKNAFGIFRILLPSECAVAQVPTQWLLFEFALVAGIRFAATVHTLGIPLSVMEGTLHGVPIRATWGCPNGTSCTGTNGLKHWKNMQKPDLKTYQIPHAHLERCRCRLTFRDANGELHKAKLPLPEDLRKAAHHLIYDRWLGLGGAKASVPDTSIQTEPSSKAKSSVFCKTLASRIGATEARQLSNCCIYLGNVVPSLAMLPESSFYHW